MNEAVFIAALRALAVSPGARGLADDAAVLAVGGTSLVLTHDMIVEGVHFLPGDPPGDVAWKLVAVNLSDLAAKGARPLGALMGYSLAGDDSWDRAFVAGLEEALAAFSLPLLGGDTVSMPAGAPRALGLTAIGQAGAAIPSRSSARPGDGLWVTGTIGDAGAGLRALLGEIGGSPELVARYRRPQPRLQAGRALAPHVHAMMDVSDGLLIDAARMAAASGLEARVDLASLPLSPAFVSACGEARLEAATAGDDYELLFAAPEGIAGLVGELGVPIARVGAFAPGEGLRLFDGGSEVALPPRLGFEHG
jgi:thiamine-monophosphate kinase